jgi:hypothetical protein
MFIDSLCMRDCPRKVQLAFRSIREIICGWPLWLLATTIAVYCHGAQAHGIVGNRVFPGSFAFDDPAVMDELLFGFSRLRHPDDGTEVLDHQADWAFSRLLTPTLAIEFDGGWLHRNWGPTQRSGLDTTAVGLKALLYKNDIQEVMISAGIAWGIGGTGWPQTAWIRSIPECFSGRGSVTHQPPCHGCVHWRLLGRWLSNTPCKQQQPTLVSIRPRGSFNQHLRRSMTSCTGVSPYSTALTISAAAFHLESCPRTSQ